MALVNIRKIIGYDKDGNPITAEVYEDQDLETYDHY